MVKLAMKRVAIVFPLGEQRGGSEALLVHFLRFNAHRTGFIYILVFLRSGPLPDLARELGYDVRIFPAKRLRNVGNFFYVMWQLGRLFRAEKVNVVLSWMSKVHLYASLPALFCRIPSIWYQHGISGGGVLDELIAALPASLVLCCSEASVAGQRSLIFKKQMKVIYPAVDVVRLASLDRDRDGARQKIGIEGRTPIVAMFARFEKWKGVDIFVDSATEMISIHPDVRYVLVGGAHELDPDYRIQVVNRISELGMQERILLVGQRPMDEVALWMIAADIIVHPVIGAEPFGMVIVEAMALGLPVIASAIGGILEIIDNGVNGVLIPPNDAPALTSATQMLLEEESKRDQLSQNAQSRARQFSIEKMVASMEAAFDLATI